MTTSQGAKKNSLSFPGYSLPLENTDPQEGQTIEAPYSFTNDPIIFQSNEGFPNEAEFISLEEELQTLSDFCWMDSLGSMTSPVGDDPFQLAHSIVPEQDQSSESCKIPGPRWKFTC